MGLFTLARFLLPNGSVSVSEAGTDLSTTAALAKAVENFDTHAANKDTTNTFVGVQTFSNGVSLSGNALAIGDGGTGATALTNHGVVTAGASALTTVAPSTSGNVLTSNGTDWVSQAATAGTLTVLGTTFATADVTMTSATTWYTAVTLGTALVNGKTYLLSCNVSFASDVNTAAPCNGTLELFDSTNSVEIASISFVNANAGAGNTYGATLAMIKYSGFAGTPTILARAKATSEIVIKATTVHGAANQATSITAVQTG